MTGSLLGCHSKRNRLDSGYAISLSATEYDGR